MGRLIDLLALVLLLFVGMAGYLLESRGDTIPNSIVLLLSGAGVISSVILMKAKNQGEDRLDDSFSDILDTRKRDPSTK